MKKVKAKHLNIIFNIKFPNTYKYYESNYELSHYRCIIMYSIYLI